MRVAIVEAGLPPPSLVPEFGTYGDMIRAMLGPDHDYVTSRVFDGEPLPAADQVAAVIISGSSAGVYDPLPWIEPLESYLRAAASRTKLVGLCFGHQIMAQAFGGHVAKAPQGWGLGLHGYDILEAAPWMDDGRDIVATASHQDQVLKPPPGTRTLAASPFTPHAVLAYDTHPAISMQFHPEFAPEFSRALFTARRSSEVDDPAVSAAVASLDGPNDNARVAAWIDRFLRS